MKTRLKQRFVSSFIYINDFNILFPQFLFLFLFEPHPSLTMSLTQLFIWLQKLLHCKNWGVSTNSLGNSKWQPWCLLSFLLNIGELTGLYALFQKGKGHQGTYLFSKGQLMSPKTMTRGNNLYSLSLMQI